MKAWTHKALDHVHRAMGCLSIEAWEHDSPALADATAALAVARDKLEALVSTEEEGSHG